MGDNQSSTNPTQFSKERLTNKVGSGLEGFYDQGPTKAFGKSLYAGLSDPTMGGINSLISDPNNAAYGQGVSGALADYADIAAGNRYGMNDPGFAQMRQGVIDDTITATNSPFFSSGTFGSDKHKEAIGRGVSSSLANLDYGNFQNDQARQAQAAQMLPGLYGAGQAPAQAMLAGGQMLDADAQARLLAEQDLYQRQSDEGYNHLAQVNQLLGVGGVGGQVEQKPSNPWMDALGFGVGLAGLLG